jgi:hypothetical protein
MLMQVERVEPDPETVVDVLRRERDEWKNRALAAEFSIHSGNVGAPRETILLRGEWLRPPEVRNDYALLETRSRAVSILLDRVALVAALNALGGWR